MVGWLLQFSNHALHIMGFGNPQDLVGVFLVASLGEFGIPFPLVLDSILFYLGFHLGGLWLTAIIVILVLLLGRVLGATGVYWISRSLGHSIIKWLGNRFPSLPHKLNNLAQMPGIKTVLSLTVSRLAIRTPLAASATYLGWGTPLTVALARLTPGLLTATSVASGASGFRYKYFAGGIGIASILSDVASISLGAITGYGLREFIPNPSSWLMVIGIIVDIAVIIAIQHFVSRRTARKLAKA